MGIDYYGVLRIPRTSSDLDIKKAYRNLALEFHPQVHTSNPNAETVFALVSEAYEVLGNPLHRSIFDQYGEEGLKRGVPTKEEFIEPYHYHGDALRTYKEFFGTASPYGHFMEHLCESPQNCSKHYEIFFKKQPPIIHPLKLTLHEAFFGGVKKMKIHRLVYLDAQKSKTEVREKILTIPIKPGIAEGTEIAFPEEGDQNPCQIPADVIFVVEMRPHEFFQREKNNDLVMVQDVTLEEALLGTTITVNTIDKRLIRVNITDVVFPGYEKIVENEGMPVLENFPLRGNLKIRFNVSFPRYLPKASKELFEKGFQLAKIGGGVDQYETVNKLVLADKILRVDVNEQLPF